jgi:NADPH-dependent FMN reductase
MSLKDRNGKEKEQRLKVGIIVGSRRPGRKAAAVAKWVHDLLKNRNDAEFEIVDIEDYKLPLLDESVPPIMHQYGKAHTKSWSEKIASLDGPIQTHCSRQTRSNRQICFHLISGRRGTCFHASW